MTLLLHVLLGFQITQHSASTDYEAGSCKADYPTSLLQAVSNVRLGGKRPIKFDTDLDTENLMSMEEELDSDDIDVRLVSAMMKTVGGHVSWGGDWLFMVEDLCARRADAAMCRKKSLEDCHGQCQVHPDSQMCKPLRIQPYVDYAKASAASPFGLYTAAMKTCNGLDKKSCTGNCMWKPNSWAQCIVAQPLLKRVTATPPWTRLLSHVERCRKLKGHKCEASGCQRGGLNGTKPLMKDIKCEPTPDKWYSLVFGSPEGSKLLASTRGYVPQTCGDSNHMSARCKMLISQSQLCGGKDSDQCKGECEKTPKGCAVAKDAFDRICEGDASASKPAQTKSAKPSELSSQIDP